MANNRIEIEFNAKFEKYFNELKAAQMKTTGVLSELRSSFESLASFSVAGFAVSQIASFGFEAAKSAAQFENLRKAFQGTEQDLELMRKATARTVTDADLIKLSNQASDLGLTLEQQIILMSAAEDAADKYGGTVEENFMAIVNASEGVEKGLKKLGIEKAKYNEILDGIVKGAGAKNIEQLDAESQKTARLRAIIQTLGTTIDDVKNKQQDSLDKLESWSVAWEDFKVSFGETILPALNVLGNTLLWIGYILKTYIVDNFVWLFKQGHYGISWLLDKLGIQDMKTSGYGPNITKENKPNANKTTEETTLKLKKDSQKELNKEKEKTFIKTDEEIKKEIKLLEILKAKTKSLREQFLYKKQITELKGELEFYKNLQNYADIKVATPTSKGLELPSLKRKQLKEIDTEEIDKVKLDTLDIGEEWKFIGDIINNTIYDLSNGLAQAIMKAKSLREVFADIGNMLLQQTLSFLISLGLKAIALEAGVPEGLLKYANGGIINEPIIGYGAKTNQRYLFGEAGTEYVIPASRMGNVTAMQTNINVGGEFIMRGNDLHAVIKRVEKLEKRYK